MVPILHHMMVILDLSRYKILPLETTGMKKIPRLRNKNILGLSTNMYSVGYRDDNF